jgi:carnitine 3-dehydrogenase
MKDIGMFPLVIRKEIDAFVGDRFLEAVWREALWLLKDGIATTEELDDIDPHGLRPALGGRWACSRPTASPGARPACATSWPSSARR